MCKAHHKKEDDKMKFLDKSDFVFQTNIANLMSPVATFTAPLSQMYSILDNFPYLLAITAYQAFTVATPSSSFNVTTTSPIAVPTDSNGNSLFSITAVAYDVTNNTLPHHCLKCIRYLITFLTC
jgi:hypothetical protein